LLADPILRLPGAETRRRTVNRNCAIVPELSNTISFAVRDYDLAATLCSGQAFRWCWSDQSWLGVVGNHWVRLRSDSFSITAETGEPLCDWNWLREYLQIDLDLADVLLTFPEDAPLRNALAACRGLRLLRQDPWECLASFILSSTKQIVQIRQIISLLCERFGEPIAVVPTYSPAAAFPTAARLARATEADLRSCKMGFRAPYLLETARAIAGGQFDLARLHRLPLELARAELMQLPGVGRKIADCVLLFAYGFASAFPVDVWVLKALRQLYFPRRRVKMPRLQQFAATYFGANAGYAQQYLFHYMRTKVTNSRQGEEISPGETRGRRSKKRANSNVRHA
jgi:N-glycosylase/DNA lyase